MKRILLAVKLAFFLLLLAGCQDKPIKEIETLSIHFSVYDLDGTCLQQVDIKLGSVMIHTMTIEVCEW